MNDRDFTNMANRTVDNLYRIAESIDEQYAEECGDSSCTNTRRTDPDGAFVFDLIAMAHRINASGLCDYY